MVRLLPLTLLMRATSSNSVTESVGASIARPFLLSESTMVDIITALQADPTNQDKVHVFINGKHAIAVALDVAANEQLTVGQPCPPERLEKLHAAQELHWVYERAMRYLSYRPRSEREVEMQLRKKGHTPEQIAPTMQKLRKRGYVDDREFARFWVNNRMAFSPRGPRLLRSELRQKGVPVEIVDEIMSEQSEVQEELKTRAEEIEAVYGTADEGPVPGTDLANALALAQKRMRTYGRLDEVTAKRRLSGFLMRRGYGYDVVGVVMKQVFSAVETFDDE